MRSKFFIATCAAVSLAACSPTGGNKEQIGTVMGAAVGGIVGSQFGGSAGAQVAGGLLGAALGGLIGNRIGAALDEDDRKKLAAITQQSAASGGARAFKNSKSGISGRTRVTGTSTNAAGQMCRTVDQEIVKRDGTVLKDQVVACRTEKGWVI